VSETFFSLEIQPRFNETDALGHINNTIIPVWNEAARKPIFEIFNPELDLDKWELIVAGFDIAFLSPTNYGSPVSIKTWISRVGNSSFEVTQQSWQQGKQTSETKTSMVYYDYGIDKSQPLSTEIKQQLSLLTGE